MIQQIFHLSFPAQYYQAVAGGPVTITRAAVQRGQYHLGVGVGKRCPSRLPWAGAITNDTHLLPRGGTDLHGTERILTAITTLPSNPNTSLSQWRGQMASPL